MTLPWSGQWRRTMTATPAEFVAALGTAFPGAVVSGDGWVEVSQRDTRLRFEWSPLPPLRIGALVLARIDVLVRIVAGDADAAQAFLNTVDRLTQRGGG